MMVDDPTGLLWREVSGHLSTPDQIVAARPQLQPDPHQRFQLRQLACGQTTRFPADRLPLEPGAEHIKLLL